MIDNESSDMFQIFLIDNIRRDFIALSTIVGDRKFYTILMDLVLSVKNLDK